MYNVHISFCEGRFVMYFKKNVCGRLKNTFLAFAEHVKGRRVGLTFQYFFYFFLLSRPVKFHPHSTTPNAFLISKLCLNYYVKKNTIKY